MNEEEKKYVNKLGVLGEKNVIIRNLCAEMYLEFICYRGGKGLCNRQQLLGRSGPMSSTQTRVGFSFKDV